MTYIDTKYPPTKNVEVLRIKPVDRDFIELGELKLNLNKSNTDTAILVLKNKAKSIGADAIIVQEPMAEGYISTGSFLIPVRSVNAIALRYKN